jgi:hypothetical protein
MAYMAEPSNNFGVEKEMVEKNIKIFLRKTSCENSSWMELTEHST